MVFRKSEYQKQYSPAILMKHIPIYEANLESRNKRRDHQYSHTSIAWDDTDLDTPSTSEEEIKEAQNKLQEMTIHKDKECEASSSPDLQKNIRPSDKHILSDVDGNYLGKINYTSDDEPIEKLDLGKTKVIEWGKKKRTKRPDRKQKIPRGRPTSAPASRQPVVQHSKPFLSYGHGDGEKSTGILWTHNVRAGTQVYASAMRAKKLREVEATKREDRRGKYIWINERKKNAILQLMKKETADWETEYQKHYPAYDKVIYERALSARPDSRPEY